MRKIDAATQVFYEFTSQDGKTFAVSVDDEGMPLALNELEKKNFDDERSGSGMYLGQMTVLSQGKTVVDTKCSLHAFLDTDKTNPDDVMALDEDFWRSTFELIQPLTVLPQVITFH